jgi:N-acetylmuramoyl-L-alanine amidase
VIGGKSNAFSRAVVLLAVAASTLPFCARAGSITATEWRAAKRDEQTRLVVELSDSVAFSISGAAQPLRLTVQLPSVSAHLGDAPTAIGVIAAVKAEASETGTALVIRLAEPAVVAKSFVMSPSEGKPYRLVIDLEPCSRARFAQAFIHEERPEPVRAEAVKAEPPKSEPVKTEPAKADAPPVKQAPEIVHASLPIRIAPPPPPPEQSPALSFPASPAPAREPLPQPSPGQVAIVTVPLPPDPPLPPPIAPPVASDIEEERIVIALDPGHGGIDPGATGRDGIREKAITLATAEAVKQALEASGRYRVVMTRGDDSFVRLRERVRRARVAGAKLFISIHADVLSNASISGLSVYTLSETATDREAEGLAAKENKADVIEGVDLTDSPPEVNTILIDLAQRETNTASFRFADRLVHEIRSTAPVLVKPHREAGFAVLTAPDIPSVLIELGYLSNSEEEVRLESPAQRTRLAQAILRAVDQSFTPRGLRRS